MSKLACLNVMFRTQLWPMWGGTDPIEAPTPVVIHLEEASPRVFGQLEGCLGREVVGVL